MGFEDLYPVIDVECDNCGKEFEVNDTPGEKSCPHCGEMTSK